MKKENERIIPFRLGKVTIPALLSEDYHIKTPEQLAEAYIYRIIGNQFNVPSVLSPKEKTNIKSYDKRLSSKTKTLLKETCNSHANISMVIGAVIDFEYAIRLSKEKTLNKFIEIAEIISKNQKEVIHSCEVLLSQVIMSEAEIEAILSIKNRFETSSHKRQIRIDSIKEVELLDKLHPPSDLATATPDEKRELHLAWIEDILQMLQFDFKRLQSRPKHLFFKGLQICIYKIIRLENPKKELAKELTARIINECIDLDFLPKLTAKDIDNTVNPPYQKRVIKALYESYIEVKNGKLPLQRVTELCNSELPEAHDDAQKPKKIKLTTKKISSILRDLGLKIEKSTGTLIWEKDNIEKLFSENRLRF